MIGAVECLEVLMGFHQHHMTQQVTFLHTELQPKQRMLKHKAELEALGDEAEDIYVQKKLEGVRYCTYLPIFKSQKGYIEALNFLIITS